MENQNFIAEREKEEKQATEKEKEKETREQPPEDSKTEGIANDMVGAVEPFVRVVEKLTGQQRGDFMGKLVMGAMKGKLAEAFGGAFGENKKKTRIEKFKDAFEIAIWIMLLLMLFFWLNLGIARWMGVMR